MASTNYTMGVNPNAGGRRRVLAVPTSGALVPQAPVNFSDNQRAVFTAGPGGSGATEPNPGMIDNTPPWRPGAARTQLIAGIRNRNRAEQNKMGRIKQMVADGVDGRQAQMVAGAEHDQALADMGPNDAPVGYFQGRQLNSAYASDPQKFFPDMSHGQVVRAATTPRAAAATGAGATASADPKLRDQAYAYNAVARSTHDPQLAGQLSGMVPGNPATQPSTRPATQPSAGPTVQPSAQPAAASAAAATPQAADAGGQPGKEQQPNGQIHLTIQHAKAIWDGINRHGGVNAAYDPHGMFQEILAGYGISPDDALGMARQFTYNASDQGTASAVDGGRNGDTFYSPDQLGQIRDSGNDMATAQRLNPYTQGNVVPGYKPLQTMPRITKDQAAAILREASGDKDKARQLAIQRGFDIRA